MVKPKMILGLSQEISFTVITWNPVFKLYAPREESLHTPLKYIDVTRTTDTTLDVMSEKTFLKIIGTLMEKKNCRMHGQVSQDSLYWRTHHRMDINTVREGRLTRKQATSRPDNCVARYVEAYVWCIETQRKAIMGHRETQTRKCQQITCYFLYWTWWWRIQA